MNSYRLCHHYGLRTLGLPPEHWLGYNNVFVMPPGVIQRECRRKSESSLFVFPERVQYSIDRELARAQSTDLPE